MRTAWLPAVLVLVSALAGCETSNFGSSSGKPAKSEDGSLNCEDDAVTVKAGESAEAGARSCSLKDAKSTESHDPDIAEIGPDGKVVGKKPGETVIDVVNEDGSKTKVHVTVTDDSSSTDPGEESEEQDPGRLGEEDAKADGCTIQGDRIKWKWPKKVQDCFDDKKLWDFTREECTTVPEATSFECDWDGINSAVKGIDANFTPDWDKKRLKLISCGEREQAAGQGKKKTVVWQYVMLPKEAQDGKCSLDFGAGIAIGCFSETKLSLATPSSDPADLHACMDN